MASLVIENLSMSFGALEVIRSLSLEVGSGERHAIIGPNGAGKTTLFNLVTGWLRPRGGRILLDGRDIAGMPPRKLLHRGLARSFQRNTMFDGLTVLENLRLACQARSRTQYNPLRDRTVYKDIFEKAHAVAQTMALGDSLNKRVDELSYGRKRQLEVGLALCGEPRILLLDEPAAGASPDERARLISLIDALPRAMTLVLIEHDMDLVFGISDRVTVLDYGSRLATGRPEDIRGNEAVREAYLGKSGA